MKSVIVMYTKITKYQGLGLIVSCQEHWKYKKSETSWRTLSQNAR